MSSATSTDTVTLLLTKLRDELNNVKQLKLWRAEEDAAVSALHPYIKYTEACLVPLRFIDLYHDVRIRVYRKKWMRALAA